ncbi:MAG TPA: DNA repair protein RecN [Paenalcaligenes sp.]|nr:DNA repair protein RecN [Paenalcaligenes sp.]
MLQLLHIRNFVIVDEAHISFQEGFSVFSGETGAGKSILIDALSLALGARAEQGFIRQGAERAEITATFSLTPAVQAWLDEHDLDVEDELILRRTIGHHNRSRAFINGTPTPLNQLRALTSLLVDIHGQHAHQNLLNAQTHAQILDEQGQHQELAAQTRQAWQHWQQHRQRLKQAQTEQSRAHEQLEQLQWQIEQLESLSLADNEWAQLTQEQQRLAHAHTLLDQLSLALNLLEGDRSADGLGPSAQSSLFQAEQHVQEVLPHDDRLQNVSQSLTSAHIACTEAISDLNSYISNIEIDPARLEEVDARMAQAFDLSRRFNCTPDELPAKYQSLCDEREQLEQNLDIEALEKKCQAAEQAFNQQAEQLSRARQQTATWLAEQVTQSMQELAMEGGRFEVQLTPCSPYAGGLEQVEFLVAGHAGSPPAPMAKVASGGELARISLALSVIASRATRVPTLIFDEVDTGIGGAVAEVVGRLLAQLGERHQVLCVTHLAQVAARAGHHFEVSKKTQDDHTISTITALDEPQRIDELARMLGGIEITPTTREHAREMLGR